MGKNDKKERKTIGMKGAGGENLKEKRKKGQVEKYLILILYLMQIYRGISTEQDDASCHITIYFKGHAFLFRF